MTTKPMTQSPKTIGIVTMNISSSINYGGVLQAFALQHKIKNLGYACETINYSTSGNRASTFLKNELKNNNISIVKLKRILRMGLRFGVTRTKKIVISLMKKMYLNKHMDLRRAAFSKFKNNFISISEKAYLRDTINESTNKYDAFVCGSDMIWKPGTYDPTYFLDFVPDNKLKIAYAPSIGISQLNESEKSYMSPLVNRLDAISVREKQGKTLLETITNKDVSWVLDPTMLISREEWDMISKPYSIGKPYIFCYLLGKNKDNYKFAKDMAKRNNLIIVTMPYVAGDHLCGIRFGDKQIYDAGPSEFISLVRNAEMVITDSFHGTVFSIIYQKRFYSLLRSKNSVLSSNSRIYSLLELFYLEKRLINTSEISIDSLDSEIISYDGVNELYNENKSTSEEYIISNLQKITGNEL